MDKKYSCKYEILIKKSSKIEKMGSKNFLKQKFDRKDDSGVDFTAPPVRCPIRARLN